MHTIKVKYFYSIFTKQVGKNSDKAWKRSFKSTAKDYVSFSDVEKNNFSKGG